MLSRMCEHLYSLTSICVFSCHRARMLVHLRLTDCEGYQWNTNLFPDPPAFIAWAHSEGDFELVLNIHDQCGVDECQAGESLVIVVAVIMMTIAGTSD